MQKLEEFIETHGPTVIAGALSKVLGEYCHSKEPTNDMLQNSQLTSQLISELIAMEERQEELRRA